MSAHGAPLTFAEYLQTVKPDIWSWVQKHHWNIAKPNYREAYERLIKL